MCVLGLGYIKKEEHIHKHRSVGGSCQRHCAQLPRHQNRPNPNATETSTPVYLHVAEYKLINPRRACAGGLRYLSCVSVCLSVCLSVTTLATTSFILTLKVRYVGVYYRLFLDFNSWIFDKTFRSKVMAWKS